MKTLKEALVELEKAEAALKRIPSEEMKKILKRRQVKILYAITKAMAKRFIKLDELLAKGML